MLVLYADVVLQHEWQVMDGNVELTYTPSLCAA